MAVGPIGGEALPPSHVLGRRWTITGAFLLAIPGLLLMVTVHRMGSMAMVSEIAR